MSNPTTWTAVSSHRARQIVRNVLKTVTRTEIALGTREIFQKALTKYPAPRGSTTPTPSPALEPQATHKRLHRPKIPIPQPPRRNHPIRSIRYLKTVVLADMQKAGEIEKVYIRRAGVTDNGNPQVSVRSRVLGRTETALHEMKGDQRWGWKLLPGYESRQRNYLHPPLSPHHSPKNPSQTTSTYVPPRSPSRTDAKDR